MVMKLILREPIYYPLHQEPIFIIIKLNIHEVDLQTSMAILELTDQYAQTFIT